MGVSNPYVIPFSWRNVALVVVGGLALWGVPWLVWPSRSPSAGKADRPAPPAFRYIRATKGLDGSTWSPVLMPLPTPDGFSKKAALKEFPGGSLVSVLKPKISEPVYVKVEPAHKVPVVTPWVSFLKPVEFDPEAPPVPVVKEEGFRPSSVIRFEIQETLRYRHYEIPALPTTMTNGAVLSTIGVTAAVELDPQGRVQHVMLEQPAGIPEVDSAIVRALRSGRGQPGASSTWGRVKFFYWKTSPVQKE